MKKTALISGGSRGIGKAIAIQLASEGIHVIINYLQNEIAASDTLNEILKDGGSAELLQFDASKLSEVEQAFRQWKESNNDKTIQILINNAGIRNDNLFVFLKDEQWKNVISTNLDSFYYLTRQVIQDMVINKFGRIINIVSLSGEKGMVGQVNYSAAKGGVIAATKALAQEVGKKKITVNAVSPGFIRTDMTQDLDESNLRKLIPLNRFGTTEEVAQLVSFLASEKAGYITGEVISINGGLYT
jgi:3-oxoacyl-[acyl-carrier protein] reductase